VGGCCFTPSGVKYHKTNPEHKTELSYFKLHSQWGRRGRDRIVVGFITTCVMPITT